MSKPVTYYGSDIIKLVLYLIFGGVADLLMFAMWPFFVIYHDIADEKFISVFIEIAFVLVYAWVFSISLMVFIFCTIIYICIGVYFVKINVKDKQKLIPFFVF